MNNGGVAWSKAGWRTHVPEADEDFVHSLGSASLPELAERSARRFPDRIAVRVDDESITHGELSRRSAQIAAALAERIKPGDRVLLVGQSSVDFVLGYLGALRAGAVVVLANPAYTAAELAHLLADSGATLILADDALADRLDHFVSLADLPRGDAAQAPAHPAPDDLALLAYTSGTTGKPKGVPLTHRNLVVSIRAAMAAWRWNSDDVLVHALPLFHQHGLGGVHATLIAGSTARLLSRFSPHALLQAARGATVLFAVPTVYERLLEVPGAEQLRSLRLCICGSAPLSDMLAERIAATIGSLPLVRYGTTESGLDVSNPYGAARGDTVGVPLPGVLARLVDGEVQLRGPQVFSGYWQNPQATAEAFTSDGWFRTGDLAEIDPESGHLIIRGRSKELIITGGMNVYPREVELVLERHPAVAEAAVAGLPHQRWGEQVTAWVVPAGQVEADELIAHARTLLAPYKCPKQVFFLDQLPRNHMGKISRAQLDTPAGTALRRAAEIDDLGAFVELYPEARTDPGIPVAVKDNIDVAGQRVRSGTPGLGHRDATEDAPAWARLRERGYVAIGRTSVPELTWSVRTPGCRNPWNPQREAGGSSGGSAVAVAAGVVPIALGTDTGGSIRIPAALCGVAGLRPTHGSVPMPGVTQLAPSMDTLGTIAPTAADCLRVHEILTGKQSTAEQEPAGLRVGLWLDRAQPEVRRLVEAAARALRDAGVEVVTVELPLAARYARRTGYTIMLAESARLWWAEYQRHPDGLGESTAALLRTGQEISTEEYELALARAAEVRAEVTGVLDTVSALLLPTVPVTAAALDANTVPLDGRDEPIEAAYYRLTALASVTGLPALTVPAGLAADGLPVGAQLVGAAYQEALLCRLGSVIEQGPQARALTAARRNL